ncbi:Cdc7p-Dbf4p kinase complex regulatory subunit [Coniosporium apollinis]|uniref:Cdc7p-Dbf4p kinase complex regulatory subunit n=1 Tax=Coniosporium apollinis TaxID=61459 RepID=A0ABQ9P1B3_9PEZI|nr:Cdc7p-Dbf4p kinase complex regulatory subunit [Coniosporium apollinis]
MANRRVPLANLPNATNSPFRAVNAKRKSHASDQRDLAYGQPPQKRQMVEVDDEEARRNNLLKRNANNPPTALQKKFEAARESKPAQTQKPTSENLETIRQWQRHYRKAFPQFVFYFESISDDARVKILRQVLALGAREEKFFSRVVTHVVTTRAIPPELSTSPDSKTPTSNLSGSHDNHEQPRKTINLSLLERPADLQNQALQSKTRTMLETALQKKPVDPTKNDVLHKARELGMKIWPLEKLQRMMTTMFNTETGEQAQVGYNTRNNVAAVAPLKSREPDLGQLLKNEKLNGHADRAFGVAAQDMMQFQGHYIYIHDIDEKTKPVMIRDYPRVKTKEEGKWPQFRLTSEGRCPFVEDPAHLRRMQLNEQKERLAKLKAERAQSAAPRTRAAAALEAAQQRAPAEAPVEKKVLGENMNATNRPSTANSLPTDKAFCKPLDPPKTIPAKRENPDSTSMPPLFGSVQANMRPAPRYAGGEPVASGVQPSNITSAIRSKMISSTAISSTAPGPRAGTSKEVHQLKRKVLEKNNVPSANSIPSSYMNDVRAAINGAPTRAAKRKAQESLAQINEEGLSDEEHTARQAAVARQKKKVVEKELKPGYCENCREKFADFDEHVVSRKHRKFALDANNWTELDELLAKLTRPIRGA